MTIVLALWLAFADLGAVKSIPDLNRRSEMALANAAKAIDEAKTAYAGGDAQAQEAALDEIQQSVDVSYNALTSSGKEPRGSKYYKQAEIKVQNLIRRLSGFRDLVGFESRKPVESTIAHLSEIHDRLIEDIMSKRKH